MSLHEPHVHDPSTTPVDCVEHSITSLSQTLSGTDSTTLRHLECAVADIITMLQEARAAARRLSDEADASAIDKIWPDIPSPVHPCGAGRPAWLVPHDVADSPLF